MFCTNLEWDKYWQFADLIKFVFFWFYLTQACKTCVQFLLDQTLQFLLDQTLSKFEVWKNGVYGPVGWQHLFSNQTHMKNTIIEVGVYLYN